MSETKYTVYTHTSPDGKVYVGVTMQEPEKRWSKGNGYKSNESFYGDIQKYGWNNFKHEIIETGLTKTECVFKERELINRHCSNNPFFGYNRTDGGVCGFMFNHDSMIKLKNRTSNKPRKFNIPVPTILPDQLNQSKHGNLKQVYCYELNKIFESVYEASIKTGTNYDSIIKCAKGRQMTANKMHWAYVRDIKYMK